MTRAGGIVLAPATIVRLALLCALAACLSWAHAAPHTVSRDTRKVDLSRDVELLVDPSASLSAAQVAALAEAGKMQAVSTARIPMFHIDRGEAYWIRYVVDADASAPRNWMLELGRANVDHVQLSVRSPRGEWITYPEVGAAVPFAARPVPHRHFVYPVQVEPGARTSFLVRVRYAGPSVPMANLWQPAALRESDRALLGFFALYFGLAAGMILYNLLLFLAVRDAGYLLYAGFVTCGASAVASISGMGAEFVWGGSSWWTSHSMYACFAAAGFFSALLLRQFLKTRERLPRVDRVIVVLALLEFAGILLAFIAPSNIAAILTAASGGGLILLVPGVAGWGAWHRWPGARFFFAAWTVMYAGILSVIVRGSVLSDNVFVENFIAVASAVEMILLALALADRINDEKRQKEEAKTFALGVLHASQAMSSEKRVDRLQSKLGEILAALAGAKRLRVLFRDVDTGEWYLHPEEGGEARVSANEAAGRGLVSLDALALAQRTREPQWSDGVCVMPIVHHGELSALLQFNVDGSSSDFPSSIRDVVDGIAGPLAVSLENLLLVERLETRVAQRTRELRETQQELVSTARRAGRAEIATNVLHDVGNTLNSVNVGVELMRDSIARSRVDGLARVTQLFDDHQGDLAGFLQQDAKGRIAFTYLRELSAALQRERNDLQERLGRLAASVDQVKRMVAMQQAHAGPSVVAEWVVPAELIEEGLRMAGSLRAAAGVQVETEFRDVPQLLLDKARTLRIIGNLLENAGHAIVHGPEGAGRVSVRVEWEAGRLRLEIRDDGCGIAPEDRTRIFSHGFTTWPEGHGFGLHSCAVAAGEMGGTLRAYSEGPGKGASFVLELPAIAR